MQDHSIRRYFYGGLFLAVALLSVLILWPFAKVIVLSIALSAVLFPVYRFIKRGVRASWVASLLTVVLFILVLCIPVFTIGTVVFKQSQNLTGWVSDHGGLDGITRIANRSNTNLVPGGVNILKEGVAQVARTLTDGIGNAFTATLATLFSFFLVILALFYFLKDGIHWKEMLIKFSPLSDTSSSKIFSRLNAAVNGIMKGYILIALIQGVLMGVGLWIFGVPNPALWGVVAGIASLVPTIGTAIVAIPVLIFLIVAGKTGAAVGFGIWAALLVGTIDNLLNPYLVGKKIEIHPLLVLFSVLGGIALMGPLGILIGPLTISFMYALASVYKTETSL